MLGHGPVRLPPVGVDRRAGLHNPVDEREQAVLSDVRDRLQADPPKPFGDLISTAIATIDFVAASPAVHSTLDTPDVRLVDLHPAAQALAGRSDHRQTKPVQHRPRRLVGPKPQRPLQPERRDTLLLAGHQPRRRKPRR